MGGFCVSIRWICTGEVWVRSSTVSGCAQLQVQGVPHAPGRVGGRHVEGLEVVPVGLRLGALGHREAHGHEGVLQLVAGLGDQVQVAPIREARQGRPRGPVMTRSGRGARRRVRRSRSLGLELRPLGRRRLGAGPRASLMAWPTSLRVARGPARRAGRSSWARADLLPRRRSRPPAARPGRAPPRARARRRPRCLATAAIGSACRGEAVGHDSCSLSRSISGKGKAKRGAAPGI